MSEDVRPRASVPAQLGELAFLVPFGTIVAWFVAQWRPDAPTEAIAAFTVGACAFGISRWRDRRAGAGGGGAGGALFLVAVLLLVGCASYDGPGYLYNAQQASARHEADLDGGTYELTRDHCQAHVAASLALQAEGPSRTLRLPLFRGAGLAELARLHARQAAVCDALLAHEAQGDLAPDQRRRVLYAWDTLFREGVVLVGGEAQ